MRTKVCTNFIKNSQYEEEDEQEFSKNKRGKNISCIDSSKQQQCTNFER